MNEYEKDILRLLEAHNRIDKIILAGNLNKAIYKKGIHRKGKNQWISGITGYPVGTVNTWFSRTECRSLNPTKRVTGAFCWILRNKMPLSAICRIAVALELSVWDLLDGKAGTSKADRPEIDRRSRLYWHIRRKEAEALWNDSYICEKGSWNIQDMAVRREFIDKLYLERVEADKKGTQHETDMEAEQDGKTD